MSYVPNAVSVDNSVKTAVSVCKKIIIKMLRSEKKEVTLHPEVTR